MTFQVHKQNKHICVVSVSYNTLGIHLGFVHEYDAQPMHETH